MFLQILQGNIWKTLVSETLFNKVAKLTNESRVTGKIDFHCEHLNFRRRACFEQGVPWLSGNHSRFTLNAYVTWSKYTVTALYREVLTKEHNHLASWANWLSVRLRTKFLWVWVTLQSLIVRYHACLEQGVPWHSANHRV